MSDIQISVVIPIYNSQDCLRELISQLTAALDNLAKSYEIILVNDCSSDQSWQRIKGLAKVNPKLKGISLRRNFGQDNAIMAGLKHCLGKAIVIMDDDLQHDSTDVAALLAKLDEGYDICYATFVSKQYPWFKNFGSWFNDKAANLFLKKPKGIYLSAYKAITSSVVDEIIKYDGPYPYIDGLIFRSTRNISQVIAKHQDRFAGRGNYTLLKSISVWSRLATNFSIIPLRLVATMGFTCSFLGFILAFFFIVLRLVTGNAPEGWASIIIAILFLGGIQLMSIGVIGEYIGRLFLYESKEPQFIIKEMTEKAH